MSKASSPATVVSRSPTMRVLGILGRSFGRIWGRDVMLYVGGVSFFALLAVFPAVALMVAFFKIVLNTGLGADQVTALTEVVPHAARGLFTGEVERLTNAPVRAVSAQSILALLIGAYAAHRGFKAVLAGLTFIHDETEPYGFLKFNFLAFVVALCAFVLFTVVSGAVLTIRVMHGTREQEALEGLGLDSEWVWACLGLMAGLTFLYRFAMAHSRKVPWRASIGGGIAAGLLSVLASWACAVYVDQVAALGATYGSIGAVVVFLIWLSWNVNAVFYGGALATEIELALEQGASVEEQPVPADADPALSLSNPKRFWRP